MVIKMNDALKERLSELKEQNKEIDETQQLEKQIAKEKAKQFDNTFLGRIWKKLNK